MLLVVGDTVPALEKAHRGHVYQSYDGMGFAPNLNFGPVWGRPFLIDQGNGFIDLIYVKDECRWLCYTKLMSPYSPDTESRMAALQAELLRSAPPWRKMEMLAELNAFARELALSGLRLRFPQAGEAELRRRLADLLLGSDLARKVLGEIE